MQQVCARRKLFCAVAALMGCTTVRLCTAAAPPMCWRPGLSLYGMIPQG